MSGHILEIRGYRIAVEAKSGTQLVYLRKLYEGRSDEFLATVAAETADIVNGTKQPLRAGPKLSLVT